jgi:hypothetical protein
LVGILLSFRHESAPMPKEPHLNSDSLSHTPLYPFSHYVSGSLEKHSKITSSSPCCHLVIIPAFILSYPITFDLLIPIERHLPRNRFSLCRSSPSFNLIPLAGSRKILFRPCSSPSPRARTDTRAPLPLLKSLRLQAQRSGDAMQFLEKSTCIADWETVCVSTPERRSLRVAVGAGKGERGGIWICFGVLSERYLGVRFA